MVNTNFTAGYNPAYSLRNANSHSLKHVGTSFRGKSTISSDAQKLVGYINNTNTGAVAADTFGASMKSNAGSALLFEGLPALAFFKNSKNIGGKFVSPEMQQLALQNKDALTQLFKGEGKLTQRFSNYLSSANASNATFSGMKEVAKTTSKATKATAKATKLAEKLATKPDSKWLQKVSAKAAKKADKALAKQTAAISSKTAGKAAGKAAAHLGKLGKVGKWFKASGAPIMLAFSAAIEGCTEVIPTFKELGPKAGFKQLGKSLVKVGGDTLGFVAGQQIGVAVGTAIGTAICPVIGSAVGAVVGFLGGMVGSWAMGKLTKAVTGKSEREKAAEQQNQNNMAQIANDPQAMEQIKAEAYYKIQQEAAMNNGQLSQESLEAYQALQNLNNPYMAA